MKSINKGEILNNLHINAQVICLDTVDSTSSEIRRIIDTAGLSTTIVAANEQTCGRGRRGRSFYSPLGQGLYMSIALPVAEENTVFLTCAAAVGVCGALQDITGAECEIKWVNDIILNNKKIAGILCERINGGVIIGVGINLCTREFPKELSGRAGSLDIPCNPSVLCAAVGDALYKSAENPSLYLREYKSLCRVIGQEITFERNGTVNEGTAVDITDNGALCVQTAKGIQLLDSGEITIRTK